MHNIESIDHARWVQAQQRELAEWQGLPADGSDWNEWWSANFENYDFLRGVVVKKILEVGCGPWAKNVLNVLRIASPCNPELFLLDPLMDKYVAMGKSVASIKATRINAQLEEMELGSKMDLIICINVLDHVQSVGRCFSKMEQHLNPGGMLILGQDLTNEEDWARCPEVRTDIMHPIKLDLGACEQYLHLYRPIMKRVLSRNAGRNPAAHYATLLFAGILK